MNITYEYSTTNSDMNMLTTIANDGSVIGIVFDELDPYVVLVNGYEYELDNDQIKGLYVDMGSGLKQKFIAITDIVNNAANHIEGFVKEEAHDAEDYSRHVDSLRAPSGF